MLTNSYLMAPLRCASEQGRFEAPGLIRLQWLLIYSTVFGCKGKTAFYPSSGCFYFTFLVVTQNQDASRYLACFSSGALAVTIDKGAKYRFSGARGSGYINLFGCEKSLPKCASRRQVCTESHTGGGAHGVISGGELLPDGRGPLLKPRVRVLALQRPRSLRGAKNAVAKVCRGGSGRLLRGLRRAGHRARPQNLR